MKLKKRKKKLQKLYSLHMIYNFDGKNPFDNRIEVCRFKYWKVVIPKFEYNRVLKKHYVLVPFEEKKHFIDLQKEAREEFFMITSDLNRFFVDFGNIDYVLVNKDKDMTIKCIFHAHIGERKWWFRPFVEKLFF